MWSRTSLLFLALMMTMGSQRVISAADVSTPLQGDPYEVRRMELIREIENDVLMTRTWIGKGELSHGVMSALSKVPRHEFVPAIERAFAYENRPLPIGHGQTISQPYIVALMTDLLAPKANHVILEIGTGSGYQAAVLSELVKSVHSIEIVPQLGKKAKQRLDKLKYSNVTVRIGDGYYGWKEAAPFDGIIVTAASSHIPPPLVQQLKPGGRMVIPLGGPFTTQVLMLVEKKGNDIHTRQILPVRFVPLTGKH